MAAVLIGNWWVLALRGVAAMLFAIIAFTKPGMTAEVVVLLFGVYAFVAGIFARSDIAAPVRDAAPSALSA